MVAHGLSARPSRCGSQCFRARRASHGRTGGGERLSGKPRDELLRPEVLMQGWRRHYGAVRANSALRCRPPMLGTILPWAQSSHLCPRGHQ